MARKGNQQKNGLDSPSSNQKKGVSDSLSSLAKSKKERISETKVVGGEELSNRKLSTTVHLTEDLGKTDQGGDEKKSKRKSGKYPRNKKQGIDEGEGIEHAATSASLSHDSVKSVPTAEASGLREEYGQSPTNNLRYHPRSILTGSVSGFRMGDTLESIEVLYTVVFKFLKTLSLSALKTSKEWLEKKKPLLIGVATKALIARDYVRIKFKHAYPIVLQWTMHFANIIFLLGMVWLNCCLRGIDSFLQMGTTAVLATIWFSILSLVTMVGVTKVLVILAITAFTGFMAGLAVAIILTALSGTVLLWLYGSFWTTAFFIFFGGMAFMFSHERFALLVTTLYSVYCAWSYVGWLGLLFGLNLSFISSDALIFFLKNNINERRSSNTTFESAGAGNFSEQGNPSSSETGSGLPADRSSGAPSTSGFDSDSTSEDEVVRLLNCADHYSALGLSKFENIDVSILKREYRKKAMMVHPDKNMGNEKAAEAFKKLQNAYEVLLDTIKRKSYDDELRSEELLNYFRRFQGAPQQDAGYSFFTSRYARTDADEDPPGESRRIACRKCNNLHVWFYTNKLKSKARWCQDCNEFHQAKDGDGWVEQSSQPFLFGLMQKVDAPSAYICADGKIYDATEWYICQGMRCPVNTHKPSFHVNTSVTSKHTGTRGMNTGQRGGGIPASNMETMTEEEFVEWLQNAMQSGIFDNFADGNSDSPNARSGSNSKSGGGNPGGGGASSSGGKRKKKGKKR